MRVLKRGRLHFSSWNKKQLVNKVNGILRWMGYRCVGLDNIFFQDESMRSMEVGMGRDILAIRDRLNHRIW